jgi:hypothetical protein
MNLLRNACPAVFIESIPRPSYEQVCAFCNPRFVRCFLAVGLLSEVEMKHCIICGDVTSQPIAAAVEHFRPFHWEHPRYIFGNIRTFGFLSGMRANLCLFFPFLGTLLNWKYRKMHLEIETTQGERPTSQAGEHEK